MGLGGDADHIAPIQSTRSETVDEESILLSITYDAKKGMKLWYCRHARHTRTTQAYRAEVDNPVNPDAGRIQH